MGSNRPTDDQRVIDFVELWIEPPLLHPNLPCPNLRRFCSALARQVVLPLTR
jgi:hypothetical protein